LSSLIGSSLSALFGLGGAGAELTTRFSYDFADRLVKVSSPDPTANRFDPVGSQSVVSSYVFDGLGRATTQMVGAVHHQDRVRGLDARLGVVSAFSVNGVDGEGRFCLDRVGSSSSCRVQQTVFAGQSTQVAFDGVTPVSWSSSTRVSGLWGFGASSRTRSLDVVYGPDGPTMQVDSRFGSSYLHADVLGWSLTRFPGHLF
jgi:hypothetical protein